VLLDLDGKAAQAWGVKVFPTTLMIDVAGRPRLRVKGEVDWTGPAAEKLIAGPARALSLSCGKAKAIIAS
jgi:hypothetical protein